MLVGTPAFPKLIIALEYFYREHQHKNDMHRVQILKISSWVRC
jgi:hypothetical protein